MKCLMLLAALASAAPLASQTAGETGAHVLQFHAGSRAAALSGAYTSAYGDADALFFNPAGIAAMASGASFSYETHASDVALGSVAAFTHIRALRFGASLVYLNAGDIAEIVPDGEFGFNSGTATGNRIDAGEIATRVSVALPLFAGRVRAGASIGFVSVNIAEVNQTATIADVGIQYDLALMTFSIAARNLGGTLGATDERLPTEIRIGALVPVLNMAGVGANFFIDGISRVHENTVDFAGGIEAGLIPNAARDVGAVIRVGYDGESGQLGALRFGAGLSLRSASVDYTFQSMDVAGSVHRLGVRWAVR
jgi:hypothetical protein